MPDSPARRLAALRGGPFSSSVHSFTICHRQVSLGHVTAPAAGGAWDLVSAPGS